MSAQDKDHFKRNIRLILTLLSFGIFWACVTLTIMSMCICLSLLFSYFSNIPFILPIFHVKNIANVITTITNWVGFKFNICRPYKKLYRERNKNKQINKPEWKEQIKKNRLKLSESETATQRDGMGCTNGCTVINWMK